MPDNKDDSFDVDDILKQLFKPATSKATLRELFNRRLEYLEISETNATEILKVQSRTLKGILSGTQKIVDFTNLIKIANFLQLPKEQVIKLYLDELEKHFPNKKASSPKTVEFIKENFDLAVLKKAGFIKSVNDFNEIEKKLTSFLGLQSIFDYKKPTVDVAFSAGLRVPKNDLTRSLWIQRAIDVFKEFDNPNEFDRQALINYFPQIRWHSMNVELGLTNIIKDLFRLGITVIYQSPLPTLQLKGATFTVNNNPCIVLTNFVGFYPTLWFALIHELFHVIFDWEEIKVNKYHLSNEEDDQLTVIEREQEADNFAREYLFSKEKTKEISPHLWSSSAVKKFANNNHVHESFVYVFHAYDLREKTAWQKARRKNPPFESLTKSLDTWNQEKPLADLVSALKYKYYI
jgi:HTH-type transcriptional regulator / antitoxin HigA